MFSLTKDDIFVLKPRLRQIPGETLKALKQCLNKAQMQTQAAFQQAYRVSSVITRICHSSSRQLYYLWCQFTLLVRPESKSQGSWSCSGEQAAGGSGRLRSVLGIPAQGITSETEQTLISTGRLNSPQAKKTRNTMFQGL